jgi:aminopeptidase N
VTLRDWLDLTVKEGLTVYREHQFMADLDAATAAVTAPYGSPDWEPALLSNLFTMASAAARGLPPDAPQPSSWRRVYEADYLRDEQFAEDEGPLTHPIRPAQVTSLKSLYTDTVYVKVGGLPELYPAACLRMQVGAPAEVAVAGTWAHNVDVLLLCVSSITLSVM